MNVITHTSVHAHASATSPPAVATLIALMNEFSSSSVKFINYSDPSACPMQNGGRRCSRSVACAGFVARGGCVEARISRW